MTAIGPIEEPVQEAGETPSSDVESMSTIACPSCGHVKTEEMPTDACMYFYEIEGCGTLLKPEEGDCCVFCSYGSVPCPPIQVARRTGKEISAC